MTRITIANQSVICNDHTVYALAICNNDEITDTVYFTTEHELIEYALINDYTVIESSCEYNCVSYDLDTYEDYYYDLRIYYAI